MLTRNRIRTLLTVDGLTFQRTNTNIVKHSQKAVEPPQKQQECINNIGRNRLPSINYQFAITMWSLECELRKRILMLGIL